MLFSTQGIRIENFVLAGVKLQYFGHISDYCYISREWSDNSITGTGYDS